ncbi:hypothetical protein [Methylomonas sp. AM2-LC]|uniref:hypothetical protein n=1 Tax=Methylomonas sp. AM2-LC TaxID=3153301 RepID=UPI003266C6D9
MSEEIDKDKLLTVNTGTKLTIESVFDLLIKERQRQDAKWGMLADKDQSLAGFLIVMRSKLDDAGFAWMNNSQGDESTLAELLKAVATGVAALQQYGVIGNHK